MKRFINKKLLPALLALLMILSIWSPAATYADYENEFTVTYDTNGDESETSVEPSTVPEGDFFFLPSPDLLMKNNTFLGWNTQADGRGDHYRPADKFSPTEDTTLYAFWGLLYEAEDAELLGSAEAESREANVSGGANVGYLDSEDSGVKFHDLPKASSIAIRYAVNAYDDATFSLFKNDTLIEAIEFINTEDYDIYKTIYVDISIQDGDSLSLINQEGDWAINIDYIALFDVDFVDPVGVSLATSTLKLAPYHHEIIEATFSPANTTIKKLNWTSSDENVAKVLANGTVVAIAAGSATITATSTVDHTITATRKVTVAYPSGQEAYAVDISGGEYHFLTLLSDGYVVHTDYQNIDTESDDNNQPLIEPVMTEAGVPFGNIKAISAYGNHNLALDNEGRVWAWGSNDHYESGIYDEEYVEYPTLIQSFEDYGVTITAISAGYYHSLALDSEGQVWAWGDNEDGRIGIDDYYGDDYDGHWDMSEPVMVQTEDGDLVGIKAISAGRVHSLALSDEGQLWFWGEKQGYGTFTLATPISDESDEFTSISAGDNFNLAIKNNDDVFAWGMGATIDIDPASFKQISFEEDNFSVKSISASKYYDTSSYIQLSNGSYWCWDLCHDSSGLSSYLSVTEEPQLRTELNNFKVVSSMESKMVGLKDDGTVWVWDTLNNEDLVTYIPLHTTVTDSVYTIASEFYSLVLKSDKRVYAYGSNEFGQLGQGTFESLVPYNAQEPAPVITNSGDPLENVELVKASGTHVLAMTTNGSIWTWGHQQDIDLNVANPVNGLSNVVDIAAGKNFSLALKSNGTVVGWGDNGRCQLSNCSLEMEVVETPISLKDENGEEMTNIKAISAGSGQSVAIVGDEGHVYVWGVEAAVPYHIHIDEDTPLDDIIAIEAGAYDDFTALREDGTLWYWGADYFEGPMAYTFSSQEGPILDIKQISYQYGHLLVLTEQGEVWSAWNNQLGQLGLGKYDDYYELQKVTTLSNVYQVSAGYSHSLVVLNDEERSVKGFGKYNSAQIPLDLLLPLVQVEAFKAKPEAEEGQNNQIEYDYSPVHKIITTNGQIGIGVGQLGQAQIDDELILDIPVGASDEFLFITLQKLTNTTNLTNHGEVFASPVFELLKNVTGNFKKAVTITLKFDPTKVKEGLRVAIFYYDEGLLEWVEIGGQVSNNFISAEVDHFTKFAVLVVGDESKLTSFSDIAGHWAEVQIKQAVQQGIVNGYPDGTFKPDATVTRAEFTAMLAQALKLDGDSEGLGFSDEEQMGDWEKLAVSKAVKAKIVSGYEDGSFRPQANISRAQLATMIARASGIVEVDTMEVTDFADDSEVASWAKAPIAYVRKAGILNGRGGNRFVPNASATRAEAITVILNMLKVK